MPYQNNFGSQDWPEYQQQAGADSFNGWRGARAGGAVANQGTQNQPSKSTDPYQAYQQAAMSWPSNTNTTRTRTVAPPGGAQAGAFNPGSLADAMRGISMPTTPMQHPGGAGTWGGGTGIGNTISMPTTPMGQPGGAGQWPDTSDPTRSMAFKGAYQPYSPSAGSELARIIGGGSIGGGTQAPGPAAPTPLPNPGRPQFGQQPRPVTVPTNPNPPPMASDGPTGSGQQGHGAPPNTMSPLTPTPAPPNSGPGQWPGGGAQQGQGGAGSTMSPLTPTPMPPGGGPGSWQANQPLYTPLQPGGTIAGAIPGQGGAPGTIGGAIGGAPGGVPGTIGGAIGGATQGGNALSGGGVTSLTPDGSGGTIGGAIGGGNPNTMSPQTPTAMPPGGGGPGSWPGAGGGTGGGPSGLPPGFGQQDIISAMRGLYQPGFDQEQEQYSRQMRAQGAMNGGVNSGGFNVAYGRGMGNLIAQEGKQLADAIFTGNQNDLNRSLQKYGIDMSNLTQEDIAKIQAASQQAVAGINSGASLYGVLQSIKERQWETQANIGNSQWQTNQNLGFQGWQTGQNIGQRQWEFGQTMPLEWGKLQAGLYQGDQQSQLQWAALASSLGLTPQQLMSILQGTTPSQYVQP